jgi:hypothetical protein
MSSAINLGGVPVLSRPSLKPAFEKVFERPYEASSPSLPAGIVIFPL